MKAVLDACVLYPTVLREILQGAAAAGLYEPVFSDRILREWTLAAAKLGPGAQAVAEGEAALLRAAFPRALTRERPEIEARLHLPGKIAGEAIRIQPQARLRKPEQQVVARLATLRGTFQQAGIAERMALMQTQQIRRLQGHIQPDETRHRRSRQDTARCAQTRRNIRVPLVPPKPKPFDITASTRC